MVEPKDILEFAKNGAPVVVGAFGVGYFWGFANWIRNPSKRRQKWHEDLFTVNDFVGETSLWTICQTYYLGLTNGLTTIAQSALTGATLSAVLQGGRKCGYETLDFAVEKLYLRAHPDVRQMLEQQGNQVDRTLQYRTETGEGTS